MNPSELAGAKHEVPDCFDDAHPATPPCGGRPPARPTHRRLANRPWPCRVHPKLPRQAQNVRRRDAESQWRAASAALQSVPPPSDAECLLDPRDFCETNGGRVILIRHGESTWNSDSNGGPRFTGWHDVPLSAEGELQAGDAARALLEANVCADVVYTSTLKRTIKTAWLLLEQLDAFTMPLVQSWRLNERAYGALTGHNKAETRAILGEAAFEQLRHTPPPVDPDSCYAPSSQSRFESVPYIPLSESFEDARDRVMPYWSDEILPRAMKGETVLVISSKNLLRGLLMGISDVPAREICDLDIPNCVPLVWDAESGAITQLMPREGGKAAEGRSSSSARSRAACGRSSQREAVVERARRPKRLTYVARQVYHFRVSCGFVPGGGRRACAVERE